MTDEPDHDTEAEQELESRRDAQALEVPPVLPNDEAAYVRKMPVDVMARRLLEAERKLADVQRSQPEGPARVREDGGKARTLITSALLAELSRRLGEYENAILWNTSCLACPAVLDRVAEETFRRERAEAKMAAIAALEPLRSRGFRPGATGVVEEFYLRQSDILAIIGTEEKSRDR